MSELGQQDIRHLRRALGLNASDFGALVGVSGRTIEDYEQGRRKPSGPARKIMAQLAKKQAAASV
jgi:putative transcriptional regulator